MIKKRVADYLSIFVLILVLGFIIFSFSKQYITNNNINKKILDGYLATVKSNNLGSCDYLGKDYKNCGPAGGASSCCKSTELCCGGTSTNAVCCNPDKYECGGALGNNYCKAKNCGEGQKICSASILPTIKICCPNDAKCGVDKSGDKNTPFCGSSGCKADESVCISGNTTLCCKSTQKCIDILKDGKPTGKKTCSAKECPSGSICSKSGNSGSNDYSICCSSSENCFHYPNGYPRCV
jgi:hypothetical protein